MPAIVIRTLQARRQHWIDSPGASSPLRPGLQQIFASQDNYKCNHSHKRWKAPRKSTSHCHLSPWRTQCKQELKCHYNGYQCTEQICSKSYIRHLFFADSASYRTLNTFSAQQHAKCLFIAFAKLYHIVNLRV
jgi:hypothetical protein